MLTYRATFKFNDWLFERTYLDTSDVYRSSRENDRKLVIRHALFDHVGDTGQRSPEVLQLFGASFECSLRNFWRFDVLGLFLLWGSRVTRMVEFCVRVFIFEVDANLEQGRRLTSYTIWAFSTENYPFTLWLDWDSQSLYTAAILENGISLHCDRANEALLREQLDCEKKGGGR